MSIATTEPSIMLAPIPFVDLGWQHAVVADEVATGIANVLSEGAFINGPDVVAFEQEMAHYLGIEHCLGVGNGTDALELAIRGAGIPAGSEIIVPANTFIASAEAVVRAGCSLRLVDCDPRTQLIDVEQVASALDAGVRVVLPVHLYGQIAPLEKIEARLADAGVALIEDAAQAQGARRHGRSSGQWGIAGGTSFYPGKNLGAYGDAGAVLTNDHQIAGRVRALRNHGGERKYEHSYIGTNSRLDTVQAVVLRAKLQRLENWNELRRAAADRYASLLSGIDGVTLPTTLEGNVHVWHLYVIEVDDRDEVLAKVTGAGVGAGIHYPTPIHLTDAFAGTLPYGRGDFPVAERLATRILSLPMFPGITVEQQERVAEALAAAVR